MDLGTLIPIVITVIIHVIGIGIFLVWFAAGRPMSKQQFDLWWKDVHFFPAWVRNRKQKQLTRRQAVKLLPLSGAKRNGTQELFAIYPGIGHERAETNAHPSEQGLAGSTDVEPYNIASRKERQ